MQETMRAVVIGEYGGSLRATRRPMARPGEGEVLVRVRASGLCSTDVHLLSGRQPLGELPRVVGHELAGDVVELGPGARGWQVGDRVTAAIDVTCGHCQHCLTGQTQRCRAMKRIGFERDGGHADYVAVPAANLVAIGSVMAYEAAAILPDAIACMYHSLIHQGGVGIGQRVLILGAGGLGIHGIQIAKVAGASVMATSRQPQRLGIAEKFGAVPVDTARDSLAAAVDRFTDGEGVDVVVDNVGSRASVLEGLSVLRPGGRFLLVGYLDPALEFPSTRLFKTEQQIIGCRGSTRQDLVDVVRLVQDRAITPVLGAHYPLERIADAVARLESGDLTGRIWLSRA